MITLNSPRINLSLLWRLFGLISSIAGLNLVLVADAQAVPSFARQTGQECAACHVGAFGPQLTPYGMNFKMRGYTDTSSKDWLLPLSGMVVANLTHTSKDQDPAPEHFRSNNNAVLQEVSLFMAGKIAPNLGAFVQGTYSGLDHFSSLDQADIRLARDFTLGGHAVTAGLSLNNNPTITSPTNTFGAWRFPYTAADIAPSPSYTTMLDDMLGQQVIGLNAYALIDRNWYAELGGYRSLSKGFLEKVNDLEDPADYNKLDKTSPYWRLGYMKDLGNQFYSVGLFGMSADIRPDGFSVHDKYRDLGVDASYQFLGDRTNIYTLNGSYTHETRNIVSSDPSAKGHLNRLDLNASYHYKNTYGLTAGLFDVRGNTNTDLWTDGFNGSPNSNGYLLQADWTPLGKEDSWMAPWANLRLGLQYTYYNKFDGTSDGAHDNNTLSLFAWTAF